MRLVAFVSAILLASTAQARGQSSNPSTSTQKVDLLVGGSFSSGSYGTASDTDIWTVPIVASAEVEGFRFSATLPWMSITSNGTVFTGIDSTPLVVAPGITSTRRHRQGFGDLTVGASYDLTNTENSGADIELSARIKVPTASDRSQLSTGKTDYSLGMRVSKPMGRLVPFVSGRYRIFGDSGPWNLRNGWAGSAGASYVLPSRTTVVASYEYARAASPFVGDAHELLVAASTPLGALPLRITAFGAAGLSRGAPDAAGGLSLAASF